MDNYQVIRIIALYNLFDRFEKQGMITTQQFKDFYNNLPTGQKDMICEYIKQQTKLGLEAPLLIKNFIR